MDPYRNPFAPDAGSRPPELAGRDAILEMARISCGRAVRGGNARSIMLLGLRGVGKGQKSLLPMWTSLMPRRWGG